MTVDTTHAGGAVQPYVEAEAGLEDLGTEDVRIPRLKIVGRNATFKDTITNEEFPALDIIILGMVKQRILWDRDVDENERPMCKSPDFVTGFPTVTLEVPADKRFPWAESGFDPNQMNVESPAPQHNGHVVLPCGSCKLKEWNGKKPPRCAEGFAYSLLYGPPGEEPVMPAILTLQRSALGAGKQYNSFFAAQKVPFFQYTTHASLTPKERGEVKYATPVLRRGAPTDQNMWDFYAQQARSIRELLRQPPRPPEGWVPPSEPAANTWAAPAAATATAPVVNPPAPAAPAAPAPAPVQATPPAPAPVAPAPVAPPTPAPAPPVAPPVVPVPAVQPAPAVTPAPPAAPAPAAAAAIADDEDDLPF